MMPGAIGRGGRMAGLLMALAAATAVGEVPPPGDVAGIRNAVEDLAELPGVRPGTTGFYLAWLDAPDRPLAERDSRRSFLPASTLKTITTGCALEILGPEFRFETQLEYAPETGDLVIRGSGDPTLGRPDWEALFEEWTQALGRAGIRAVPGRVVADESAWEPDELPGGWAWLDIGNYYAPVMSPLCFHDNAFRVWFRLRGRPGEPAEFCGADPWPYGLRILDEVTVGPPGSGDQAYAFGAPGGATYILRGTFAADTGRRYLRAALPDPAFTCAHLFTRWLNERELPVNGAPATTRRIESARRLVTESGNPVPAEPAPGTERIRVATHRSAPLRELLVPINHQSLNLDCECLIRTIGGGSLSGGIRRIRGHLAAKGLPLEGFDQSDGCGLARLNRITPALLARANAAFLSGPYGDAFRASLPVAGARNSTLRSLPQRSDVRIRAKSGTIEQVKAYAGVVESQTRGAAVFAIMVNHYDGSYGAGTRPGIERFLGALADWAAGGDPGDRAGAADNATADPLPAAAQGAR